MKNKEIEIIYGDPKKFLIFKKAEKLASNQKNFKAATSLSRKKSYKTKVVALKIKNKSYFIQKCCKERQKRAIEAQKQLIFYLSYKKSIFFTHELYMIYSKK